MKFRIFSAIFSVLALCMVAPRASAQVTISLSTSASELPMFVPGSTVDETPDPTLSAAKRATKAKALAKHRRRLTALRNHFVASVSLANRGSKAIEFTYDSPALAASHFYFTLTGEDGTTYWEAPQDSVDENGDPILAPDTDGDGEPDPIVAQLGAAGSWKQTVNVPLVIDGQPLLPGVYSFNASAGDYSATTRIEILPPIEETVTGTIAGKVTLGGRDASGNDDPGVSTPAVGYDVEVSEIRDDSATIYRQVFYWSGQTNKSGAFKISPPVGTYSVVVSGEDADGNWLSADTQVVVTEGMESAANLRILAPLGPREALENTGIHGVVTNADGTPAANRSVNIMEIMAEGSDRPAFTNYATTDEKGAFTANTPDGSFTVSVGWGGGCWDYPPVVALSSSITVMVTRPFWGGGGGGTASARVAVKAGEYAATTLVLKKDTWEWPHLFPLDPVVGVHGSPTTISVPEESEKRYRGGR